MARISTFITNLNRKKFVTFDSSPLSRTLTLIDLTALGIGSTVGVGFYILAGQVARDTAGPAVTISFLIAAVASVFAGLCYAEFGARVPKAGSAYVYSYVCVGEFVAFVIGWNLLLEYVIGTASVARGYSAYIDDLANHSISNAFNEHMHMDVTALADYPDFFAFGVTLLLTAILVIGVKESTRANNVFTAINIFVIAYVIIAGGTQGDVYNWHLSQEDVNNRSICEEKNEDDTYDWGTGGFAPYGLDGIMQGAATCFFGFVGFDVIATTGEEALRPERNIPLSISISLLFIFIAYFGMSTVLTLALPYCMADPDAPLIELFSDKGMIVSKWIVSVGAIFGFSASLLGAMFPMPRILYAMAEDGLIFRFLAKISKRFKTPAIATILSGFLAAIMTLLFSLDALIDMMSIGTLMAYTIVSVCVMLLRYAPDNETDFIAMSKNAAVGIETKFDVIHYSWKDYAKQIFNSNGFKEPTSLSSSFVNYATLSYSFICFLLALFVSIYAKELFNGDPGAIVLISIFFVLTVGNAAIIALQPTSKKKLTFQVPFVPWVPALSTFINLYLMCNLSAATWARFVIWMAIGFVIYFFYGIRNSSGSDVPKAKLTGTDSEGMKISLTNKDIPNIVVHPPTPWDSRIGTPTDTAAHVPSKRVSITETQLVGDSSAVVDNSTQYITAVAFVNINEKDKKEEINSQFIDISPEKLGAEYPDSASEDEGEGDVNGVHKVESTTTLVVATVYDDENDRNHQFKDDSEIQSKSSENFHTVVPEDLDNITNDSGITLSDSRDTVTSTSSEESESGKKTEVELATFISDKKTLGIENNKTLPSASIEGEDAIGEEEKDTPVVKQPLRGTRSDPSIIVEARIPSSTGITVTDVVSSSEPGTPKRKRPHPIKVLARASSFDEIPPSLPDSPFAKKVKNFIIIPVDVSKNDSGSDSSLVSDGHQAPSSSVIYTPQINLPPEHYEDATLNMMSDLNSKLKHLENSRQSQETSGKDVKEPDTIFIFPSLDPIRERGESKISQADVVAITGNVESNMSNDT